MLKFARTPTVPALRKELRSAVVHFFLFGGMHEIEGHATEAATAKGGIFMLLQYGVGMGLMSIKEGNDWLEALSRKQKWGEVMVRWDELDPLGDAP